MSYVSKTPPEVDQSIFRNSGTTTYYPSGVTNSYPLPTTRRQTLEAWSCASVKTPGFKYLAKKDRPINDFVAGARVRTDTHCSLIDITGRPNYTDEYICGTAYLLPVVWQATNTAAYGNFDDVEADVIQKALRKAKDLKANLPLAAIESSQTARLLVNTVNRFAGFASDFRRGRFRDAAERLRNVRPVPTFRPNPRKERVKRDLPKGDLRSQFKDLFPKDRSSPLSLGEFSSLWLEAKFGWIPLISDIQGAAELLAQKVAGGRPITAKSTSAINQDLREVFNQPGYSYAKFIARQARSKCVLNFKVNDNGLSILSQTGITDPLSLAWEALPYSFVLDWFLPVGNYLEALGASTGLVFENGFITSKVLVDVHVNASSGAHYLISNADPSEKGVFMRRYKLTSFPVPSFPTFSFGLTPGQGTSALALLAPFFKSKTVTTKQFERRLGKPQPAHDWYG